MKINHPVTNREVDFPDHLNILSTTDTKGQITYVNQDFMNVSGFDQAELTGASHNVVRHPDMPPAAFGDLWTTIKNDQSWMGIVKNRCKNGDHYWVNAFVTPIKKDGKVVEFQSVRTKPSRNDVERAEKLYQGLAANKKPFALKLPAINMGVKLGIVSFFTLLPLLIFSLLSGAPLIGSLLVFIGSFSLAVGGIWFLTRYLRKAVAMATQIVDNDLQQILYTGTRDEGGKIILAMKMLKTEIDAIAGRMIDSADQLRKTAEDLSSNVALTSQGVTHQNAETENLTMAMNEMLSTSKQVADHAQLAAEAANNASDSASDGQSVVSNTISSINHLASQVQQSSDVIKRLEQDSENIGSILDVIKTIAEQTNLLALNAAIEAARAGEQGRGFAVVADEVRSLASRTQQSTQEIETMIERLQTGARDAVSVMEEGCEKAEQGMQHAAKADTSLTTITDSVNSIKDMNALIASAAEEQSSVANEVTQNVSVITDVSELTVDTLEYSNKISSELNDVSSMLYELANHFRTLAR